VGAVTSCRLFFLNVKLRTTDRAMQTSVIVCCYSFERLDDVHSAVESLVRQTVVPHEVIVSVDNNRELYAELARHYPEPSVGDSAKSIECKISVVLNEEAQGLSPTRNAGILASTGDIVAFIDDDAVADTGCLQALIDPFLMNESVIVVGGKAVPRWEDGKEPRWFPAELNWVIGCTYDGMAVGADKSVRNVIGCIMAFRRVALDKSGFFNLELGRVGKTKGLGEETELCQRIKRESPEALITYNDVAIVYHLVPKWRLTLKYIWIRSYNEGYYKAKIKKMRTKDDHSETTESNYLAFLFLEAIPFKMKKIGDINYLRQVIVMLYCIIATGAGYFSGLLTTDSAY